MERQPLLIERLVYATVVFTISQRPGGACTDSKEIGMADWEERTRELGEAQSKAEELFDEVERRGLIRPAITESGLNNEIYALAEEMFGITTYWLKRIIRAGRNTLLPYAENPPDLTIGTDDILFLDLGPVFEQWEADFGRTFVLGFRSAETQTAKRCGSSVCRRKEIFQRKPRHYQLRTLRLRQIAGGTLRMGVWRVHCRASDRTVSP